MDGQAQSGNAASVGCRPTKPLSPAIRMARLCIEENFAETLSLEQLAALSNLSLHRFATAFREQVGMPPHRYQCHLRLEHAGRLLSQGVPPADAAIEVGFFDQSHLSRHFKRRFGVTPAYYAGSATSVRGAARRHGRDGGS